MNKVKKTFNKLYLRNKENNFYSCPVKLKEYVERILHYSWYDCNNFVIGERVIKFWSNLPSDAYETVLKMALDNYSKETKKTIKIDNYLTSTTNITQDKYTKYTYTCNTKLFKYVENILKRCWYDYNTLSVDGNTTTFECTAWESVMPLIFERARMEYLSSIHNGILYISNIEQKNWMWVEDFRINYWKTDAYASPSKKDYELLSEFEEK